MKIFLSHSSKDFAFGTALIDLLTSIGVKSEKIIFTSNVAHGIPIGKNIFQWLKEKIEEKPFVIYLLSPNYYKSVACLNEMGAAWIVENEHAMIFTPHFDLQNPCFHKGAIDPREIGFFINNKDRIISFIDSLRSHFCISQNNTLIYQKVEHFMSVIANLNNKNDLEYQKQTSNDFSATDKEVEDLDKEPKEVIAREPQSSRFFEDLKNGKLKDEEICLAKYIIDRDQFKLLAGWQAEEEVKKIEIWENINELNNVLSQSYDGVLKRFEVKNLVKISALTSFGNPKEYELINEFANKLINSEELISELFVKIVDNNRKEDIYF